MVLCAQQVAATSQCKVAGNSLAADPLNQALFLEGAAGVVILPQAGICPGEKGRKTHHSAEVQSDCADLPFSQ